MNFSSIAIERKRAKNGYWGSVRDANDSCLLTVAARGKGVVYSKDEIKELFEGLVNCIKEDKVEYRDV